ncbi:MAG: hypothetical protein EKK42_34575 [Pseudonocardiaceae bacterium]|nr:MAG: hypothetical protein EKK42_34575 [Pseudonocardiaceae bacterium]
MDDDSTNRVDVADPRPGDAVGRPGVWSVGVLAAGVENTVAVGGGAESTVAAAWATATAALVRAVEQWGRQEYRLTVAGTPVMVTPGLTVDRRVDVEDLAESLAQLAQLADAQTPPR